MAFAQRALPVLAAVLFAYAGGACLYALARRQPAAPPATGWPAPKSLCRAAVWALAVGLLYQLCFVVAALHNSPGQPLAVALQNQFYGNTDARHYIDLAQYGYGNGEAFPEQYLMIVFFPLFPALLRAFSLGGLVPYWLAALLVQLPLACLAAAGLYALACRHFGAAAAKWALAFLAVSPAAFFYWAPMTESLFLALCVWYVLCLEQGRWLPCAALGLLAGLTRAPGGLLFGLAAVWLFLAWRQGGRRPAWGAVGAMLAPAAGLGLYFLLNYAVYGNWQQYAVYQKEHWHNALGFFPGTVAYHLRYLAAGWAQDRTTAVYLYLVAVLCILAQLLVLALAARRLPAHYLAYGLAYTAVTTGVTWLISAPRYAVALFCLPLALGSLCAHRPWLRRLLLAALAACNALYMAQYLAHGPIY